MKKKLFVWLGIIMFLYGMKGVEHTQYKGLFPTAELSYADNNLKVAPVIRAYSGLVPHNVKKIPLCG